MTSPLSSLAALVAGQPHGQLLSCRVCHKLASHPSSSTPCRAISSACPATQSLVSTPYLPMLRVLALAVFEFKHVGTLIHFLTRAQATLTITHAKTKIPPLDGDSCRALPVVIFATTVTVVSATVSLQYVPM